MSLYQMLTPYKGLMVKNGANSKSLSHIKDRLKKEAIGYVQDISTNRKVVVMAKGFSNQVMESIKYVGVTVL